MPYRFRDFFDLLRTPVGRYKYADAWNYVSFPLFALLAVLYRRLVVRKTRIVAVVGSLGKTSTHCTVAAVLGLPQDGRASKNSWSDVAWRLLRLRPGALRAVFEVGIAKPGQMKQYARFLRPQVTVVTSIASDHNRSLPTLEVTRWEKAAMVRALAPDGLAVLNGDDPHVVWMKGETTARTIFYGFNASNDVRAEDLVFDWPHGLRFTLCVGGRRRPMRCLFHGRHMVYPLLAAVAVAMAEGIDLDTAIGALESVKPVRGRMQPLRLENGAWLLCDEFKSPQESCLAALEALEQIPAQRRMVVFGEVSEPSGNQHRLYRELGMCMGRIASRAIFVGSRRARDMVRGAVKAGMPLASITTLTSETCVLQIASLLRDELREGDVVLIKGRSTERLRRIVLALQGRPVRCDIPHCNAGDIACDECGMLERGWEGLRVVT
jgi:UDP-N-acetylmuramoyl-tripeptide--D-alanyl-D-alanine ligase